MATDNWFSKITSLDNLREAWLKARYYAQIEHIYYDHYGFQEFSSQVEVNLKVIQNRLLAQEYQLSPLRYVAIPKGSTERKVYFSVPKDMVVIQAIMNVLGPLFESKFGKYCFGNRLNVMENAQNPYVRWQEQYSEYVSHVRQFLNYGQNAWYLITDISNYYPSIDKHRLRGIIARFVPDERTLALLSRILDVNAINSEGVLEVVTGLPAGAIHSHFFANVYLMEFDQLVSKSSASYARYVDDICIVFESKEEMERVELLLRNHLEQWGQFLKAEKTERQPLHMWDALIEHTRKMRYATRLDYNEILEINNEDIADARTAEQYFHKLYLISEKEGDTERLVKEAAIIVLNLRRHGAEDIDKLIYSLLKSTPVSPTTLRVILSVLLEIELLDPSDRFKETFFSDVGTNSYLRINLLQLLPYFLEKSRSLKELLISRYAIDANYLVRANTYIALRQLAEAEVISLSINELRQLGKNERDTFALIRLISCYSEIRNEDVWASLMSFSRFDQSEVSTAIADTFLSLLEKQYISPSLIDSILPSFVK